MNRLVLSALAVCLLAAQEPQAGKAPTRRDSITVEAKQEPAPLEEGAQAVEFDRRTLELLPAFNGDALGALGGLLSPSFGEAPEVVVDGMPARGHRIRASQIQSVTLASSPFSAQYRQPGRNRIEILTRRAEPEYHGEVSLRLRDSGLDARPAFSPVKASEHRQAVEFELGGPLGRSKRNAFSVSGDWEWQMGQAVVYAFTPRGDARLNAPMPERARELSIRLMRQHTEASSSTFRYEHEREAQLNTGVGGITLPEAGADESEESHHATWQFRTAGKGGWLAGFEAEAGRHASRVRSLLDGPRIQVEDAFVAGGAQRDEWGTETHAEMSGWLVKQKGRHTIRAGGTLPELSRLGERDLSLRGGAFRYASLEDLALGSPFQIMRREGPGLVRYWYSESAVYAQDDIQPREGIRLSLGLRNDWQSRVGGAFNLSPRGSVAFSPKGFRNTVLRVGAGIFRDVTGGGVLGDTLRLNGETVRETFTRRGESGAVAANVVRLGGRLSLPMMLQATVSLEQRFGRQALSLGYTVARRRHAFGAVDANAPHEGAATRPDPAVGQVTEIRSAGAQDMQSVDVSARLRVGERMESSVQYSLGWMRGDTEGARFLPADSFRPWAERGWLNEDRRHRLRWVHTLRAGKLANIGLIGTVQSGRPYTLTLGHDANGDGLLLERPAGVPRNSLRLPGEQRFDVRLSRAIWRMTFAIDVLNVLNHTNVTRIGGNLNSPLLGRELASQAPRRSQFSAGFKF